MEFDGLKIGSKNVQKSAQEHAAKKQVNLDEGDFVISGGEYEAEVMKSIKNRKDSDGEKVIYGIYDNSDKSWTVRFNDFLIDQSKVTLKDKSYFFHMLAVMVDAGIPVVQALKSLALKTQNKRFRRILDTVAYNCEGGSNLSDAMSRFDDVFDESERGIVKSGEATGHLNLMLFKLSDQIDKRHELYTKLWTAAVYPVSVFAVLILVALGMLVWVFPSLLNLLTEGGVSQGSLPLATRILISIQSAVVNFWWVILIVIFMFYGMFNMYSHSEYGAFRLDYMKLNIPVIGELIRKLYVYRFVSLLGILVDAGLPVITSLKIVGNSLSNRIYKLKLQEVINDVKGGKKISESLMDSEYLFPPEIVQMLVVGEASATLGKVSEKISDQYQREIDNALKKLTSVFEPVMILVVGILVAVLAMAIMAPIFNLSTIVNS
ncbi:MAG: type II secretion system F family protein [Patescibacteria group bacterium]